MHIIGASGHGKVVAEIVSATAVEIEGIWDENPAIKHLLGYATRGGLELFKQIGSDQFILAIGDNQIRKNLAVQLNPTSITAIHPTSSISPSAHIGKGSVIMSHTSINANCDIGTHAIINTNASIDHDCKIGNFVHISPQAGLAGNVEVGEGSHIGIGACIIQGVKIGKWAVVGAGAVIIKDVPDFAVVVGNPGKIIKYNKNEQ